jgi:hypothetical protein
MKTFIVFDTETFGYVENLENCIEELMLWPEIKQICWRLFSADGKQIKNRNEFFKKGVNDKKKEILIEFAQDFQNSDLAIAHNFLFDSKIFFAECIRYSINKDNLLDKVFYDTMLNNVELCELITEKGFQKYPTLMELYNYIFKKDFSNPHDAENDVNATSECFWALRQRKLINFEKLSLLKDLIQVEEEKLLEHISIFYSSRIDFGKYIFKACNLGVIGELIRVLENDISNGENLNSNPLNIRENSKLMLDWILELEKVFLNTEDDNTIFHEYSEYKASGEVMLYLKSVNLYFPENSFQYEKSFVKFYLQKIDVSTPIFQNLAAMSLYKTIADLINKHEALETKFKNKKDRLINNKGCLGTILFLSIIVFLIFV